MIVAFSQLCRAQRVAVNASTRAAMSSLAVRYAAHGQPQDVFKLETIPATGSVSGSEVALKFIAAPIHPSDINMAEGMYGVKPPLPATAGNEGVAVVQQVGPDVTTVKVGDWVIPAKAPFGTWTQAAKALESEVMKVPNDIPAAYAATISVNPGTAYRMLRDFEALQPGDVVIQNGANGMVGLAVVQMAREMGLKTINIVRSDRPEAEKMTRLLSNLGGDVNVTDEFLNTASFNEMLKDLPPCKLALNCVGGPSATNLARALGAGGTMVTYGGMSKKPVTIPYDLLAYKQLKLRGFWMSEWNNTHSAAEKAAMIEDIAQMIRQKKLSFFFRLHDLDDFDFALKKATEPFQFRKVVLNLDFPDRLREHDARDPADYEMFQAPV